MRQSIEIKLDEDEMALKAFPISLTNDVIGLMNRISIHKVHSTRWSFSVQLDDEQIYIPVRLYWEEHRLMEPSDLSVNQHTILSCLLTRHHNGFVREKHLKNILCSREPWVQPYIVQLIGEYLIEIIQLVHDNFECLNKRNLIAFLKRNMEFLRLTGSRITSYWDCYYRKKYENQISGFTREEYPGFLLLNKIDNELKLKPNRGGPASDR